jgi:hypothetical protein
VPAGTVLWGTGGGACDGLTVVGTATRCAREEPYSAMEGWAGRNHGCWPLMDRVDDLGVVDPAQVRGGDLDIGMTELALYDKQRDPLAGHLDRVGMAELVVVPTSAQASLSRPVR